MKLVRERHAASFQPLKTITDCSGNRVTARPLTRGNRQSNETYTWFPKKEEGNADLLRQKPIACDL
jgi:hypothetical protein